MVDPTAAEADAGKREKSSVNYRRSSNDTERCGTCRYAYGPIGERRCRIVKGFINPYDTCNEWEKKR